MPGNQIRAATQYASYQVRGYLQSAGGQGVKLPPTFSGPGVYQFCA